MAFNPIDADVHNHLEGASYPASGRELASAAQSNGAPDALIEKLRNLGNEKFSGPGEVSAALVAQVSRRVRARLLRRPGKTQEGPELLEGLDQIRGERLTDYGREE